MGIEVSWVDVRDVASVKTAVRSHTRLLFAETATNPNMYLADLTALRQVADEHHLSLIIDNTFLSPYLLRLLEWGADIVVHSATKYLSGYGDTVGGVLASTTAAMRQARLKLDSFGCEDADDIIADFAQALAHL